MIKAVIFDFDGVLVESIDIKTSAFAELFCNEGEDIVKRVVDYHMDNAGVSRYDKFRYIYREILKRPLSDDEFQMLCDKFSRLVKDAVIKAPFVKGAREFLEKYHSVYKLFVITATPQEEIREILRKRGIAHFFLGVYGAPISKTDAVRQILERENISTQETVYIGDSMSDYSAARSNLVPFIARIHNNAFVFKTINCVSLPDLEGLDEIIVKEAFHV